MAQQSEIRHRPRPSFIWDTSFVTSYESLYSILSKFTQQNFSHISDIWFHFGIHPEGQNIKRATVPRLNLNYEVQLNPFAMHSHLSLSFYTYKYAHFHPYLLPLQSQYGNKRIPYYRNAIHDELRYCPECLAYKFHTPLFQAKWIHSCPVHKIPLQTHCLQCNGVTSYRLKNETFTNPFGCKCGNVFSECETDINNIIKFKKEMQKCITLYFDWISNIKNNPEMAYRHIGLSSSDYILKSLHDGYHYITEYWGKKIPPNKKIINMISPANSIGIISHIKYKITTPSSIETSEASYSVQEGSKIYTKHNYTTFIEKLNFFSKFKKESETVKLKLFNKHINCIENIKIIIEKNGLANYSFICPEAFAYILWERYWNDLQFHQIDLNKYNLNKDKKNHYSRLQTFYKIFYNQFFPDNYVNAHQISCWYVYQIFNLNLLTSLDKFIDYTLKASQYEQGYPIETNCINTDNNLYFYIKINRQKLEYEFIAWRQQIEQKLNNRLICNNEYQHNKQVSTNVHTLLSTPLNTTIEGVDSVKKWCQKADHKAHYKQVIDDMFKNTHLKI